VHSRDELRSELERRGFDSDDALMAKLAELAQEARGQVVEVFAGDHVSMARTTDGKIFHWGLGVGPVPTEVQL